MKLSQLLRGISLPNFNPEQEIDAISVDSRTTVENALFLALANSPKQRLAHMNEAIEKGASVLICPEEDAPLSITEANVLYTENPRYTYALISANWFDRPGDDLVLIGVTGTNGKTTTTHIIKTMLEQMHQETPNKVGLIGTNENKIGEKIFPAHRTTPDAYELQSLLYQMTEDNCTHVVMEVSSHGLCQHRTAGLTFEVGIFTNLTQDHLDYHHSMEEYQKAKQQLFFQSNTAIFNLDDPVGRDFALLHQGHFLSYSENKETATLRACNLNLAADHISFHCVHDTESYPVHLPIPGGFSLYNALAALTCGLALDLPLSLLCKSFHKIQGVKGRVEVLDTPCNFTVIIDYAHTPNALENILITAQGITQNRLLCLFGCGGNRDKSKRPIMGEIAENFADVLIVTSDNPRFEEPESIISDIMEGIPDTGLTEVHIKPNRKDAIFSALALGMEGDVLILAGKGHECYQEIKGVQSHMDEREIVAEYFTKRNSKKTSK